MKKIFLVLVVVGLVGCQQPTGSQLQPSLDVSIKSGVIDIGSKIDFKAVLKNVSPTNFSYSWKINGDLMSSSRFSEASYVIPMDGNFTVMVTASNGKDRVSGEYSFFIPSPSSVDYIKSKDILGKWIITWSYTVYEATFPVTTSCVFTYLKKYNDEWYAYDKDRYEENRWGGYHSLVGYAIYDNFINGECFFYLSSTPGNTISGTVKFYTTIFDQVLMKNVPVVYSLPFSGVRESYKIPGIPLL